MFHTINQPKLYLLVFLLSLAGFISPAFAADLRYTLEMPEPHTHYFEVTAELKGAKKKHIDFTMPVWAPGSYLVREFPKNVEGFTATDGNGKALRAEKIDKNTWRVYSNRASEVKVNYKVYAFELTVRTSFLDASHGYVNGTSIFMYPEGYEKEDGTLVVNPHSSFSKVSTGLKSTGRFTYTFPNYDVLADSPLEIGNHEVYTYEAGGVTHEVAMYGEGNYEPERLMADMKRVTEEAISIFGELPVDRYVFIVHNMQRGGGGLEHLNSTTLQTSRFSYSSESGYTGFLSLVAHEYFHLWNVKRLRPAPLGPFNYNEENYTKLLWVSEGITSYYDDLIVRRAGLMPEQRYLDVVAGGISNVENTPGNKVQAVSESSFDAWIKFYRQNENSNNAEVSYYTKGGVLGQLLNMEILKSTNGARDLDDVMRNMYNRYYKQLDRGFTEAEFKAEIERVAGKNMDAFFRDYVNGTKSPDYSEFFKAAGLKVVNVNENANTGSWGANTTYSDGRVTIASVIKGSSAYEAGLNVKDEIIAVNGFRVGSDLDRYVTGLKPGDELEVLIARDGIMQVVQVKVLKDDRARFKFEKVANATPEQVKIYNKWLGIGNS